MLARRSRLSGGRIDGDEYLKLLKERKAKSRVRHKYQLIGLEIAALFDDYSHKSLYIKLAKESASGGDELLRLAKDVARRKNIKNKGAYFMRLLYKNDQNPS